MRKAEEKTMMVTENPKDIICATESCRQPVDMSKPCMVVGITPTQAAVFHTQCYEANPPADLTQLLPGKSGRQKTIAEKKWDPAIVRERRARLTPDELALLGQLPAAENPSNINLPEVLRLHKLWLKNSDEGAKADLHGADLRGAILYDTNLRMANLSEANLRGANLSGVDLIKADLSEADLIKADLHAATLSEANLTWATLSEANLHGADLSGATLLGADLAGANLTGADLRGANLSEADLRMANLSEADLRGANLSWVDLRGVNLRGAEMDTATILMQAQINHKTEFSSEEMRRKVTEIASRRYEHWKTEANPIPKPESIAYETIAPKRLYNLGAEELAWLKTNLAEADRLNQVLRLTVEDTFGLFNAQPYKEGVTRVPWAMLLSFKASVPGYTIGVSRDKKSFYFMRERVKKEEAPPAEENPLMEHSYGTWKVTPACEKEIKWFREVYGDRFTAMIWHRAEQLSQRNGVGIIRVRDMKQALAEVGYGTPTFQFGTAQGEQKESLRRLSRAQAPPAEENPKFYEVGECKCGQSTTYFPKTGWKCVGCGYLPSLCICRQPERLRGQRPIGKRTRENPWMKFNTDPAGNFVVVSSYDPSKPLSFHRTLEGAREAAKGIANGAAKYAREKMGGSLSAQYGVRYLTKFLGWYYPDKDVSDATVEGQLSSRNPWHIGSSSGGESAEVFFDRRRHGRRRHGHTTGPFKTPEEAIDTASRYGFRTVRLRDRRR